MTDETMGQQFLPKLQSKKDLCEWLYSHGWSALGDAQWKRIAPLWDEIERLRAELALLKQATRCREHSDNNHTFRCTVCGKPLVESVKK